MTNRVFTGGERRAYFRLEKTLPVSFRICSRNPDRVYSATSRNISHGGMCLEVRQNQAELLTALQQGPPNAIIELQTPVLEGAGCSRAERGWISGQIDWVQKPTADNPAMVIGLSFVRVTEQTRRQLHDLMLGEFVVRYGDGKLPN